MPQNDEGGMWEMGFYLCNGLRPLVKVGICYIPDISRLAALDKTSSIENLRIVKPQYYIIRCMPLAGIKCLHFVVTKVECSVGRETILCLRLVSVDT